MNRCTKGAVRLVFDHLEKRLGTYEFVSLFEYVLTDYTEEKAMPKKHEIRMVTVLNAYSSA
ncbi:hypothetical protein BN3590_00998 [Clostridium sp. C105KSO15]|nr:hypothetical protein BN3590_00998 [Clostridium sp. C105KSO15]